MDDKIEAWVQRANDIAAHIAELQARLVMYDTKTLHNAWKEQKAKLEDHLRTTPEGYRLVKDSTWESRCWPEDFNAENGNYSNECNVCMRQFMGNKHRRTCKSCAMLAASQESGT